MFITLTLGGAEVRNLRLTIRRYRCHFGQVYSITEKHRVMLYITDDCVVILQGDRLRFESTAREFSE